MISRKSFGYFLTTHLSLSDKVGGKLKGKDSVKFLGGWNKEGSKSLESCEEGISNVGRMVAL